MSLSPSEQDKLDQFQIITSFKDEDYDKVIALLRNNYWNLEVAISKYFDGELETPQQVHNPAPPAPIPAPVHPIDPFHHHDYSSLGILSSSVKISPISNNWKSKPGLIERPSYSFAEFPILFLLLIIPKTITFILLKLSQFFEYLFPPLPNLLPNEPILESFDFNNYFEEITKDPLSFKIMENSYNEALQNCLDENKLLLLILIKDTDEFTNNKFCKKILNNETVSNFLKQEVEDENLNIFIANVNEYQGFEIAKNLKIKSLPIIYLIGNVGNASNSINQLKILSKFHIRTLNTFKLKLFSEFEKFKPELILKKIEKNELIYSRNLKKLQDDAFNESLKKDKLKLEKLEKEKQDLIDFNNNLKLNELNKFNFMISINHKYNTRDLDLPKDQLTSIRIKYSNGDSITEKFTSKETLFDLYSFIQLKIYVNSLSELDKNQFLNAPLIESSYDHQFNFELISPFPRFIVPINDELIKDIKQLWPNGSLLVEMNEDDDDDDDENDY